MQNRRTREKIKAKLISYLINELCDIRHSILWNIVNRPISKSPSQQCLVFFLNSCYFHNVDFSHCGVPRCAPGIGGTTQIWGMLKKFRRCLCPSTAKPCRHLWFIASPIRFDSTELNWPVKLRWVGSLECSWQKVPRTSRYRYRENGNACLRTIQHCKIGLQTVVVPCSGSLWWILVSKFNSNHDTFIYG